MLLLALAVGFTTLRTILSKTVFVVSIFLEHPMKILPALAELRSRLFGHVEKLLLETRQSIGVGTARETSFSLTSSLFPSAAHRSLPETDEGKHRQASRKHVEVVILRNDLELRIQDNHQRRSLQILPEP